MKLEKHLKRMQKKIGKIGLDKFRFYLVAYSEYDGDIEIGPNGYWSDSGHYFIYKSSDGICIKTQREYYVSIQDFVARLFDYSYQGYSIDTDNGCFSVAKTPPVYGYGKLLGDEPPGWDSFEYEVTISLTKNKDRSTNIDADVIEAFSKLVQ